MELTKSLLPQHGIAVKKVEIEDVEENWTEIWRLLAQSLDNPSEELGQKILGHMKAKRMGLWVIVNDNKLKALLAVTIQFHLVTGNATLLIFAGYAHSTMLDQEWMMGYRALNDFCLENGLGAITFFTRNPALVRAVKRFSAAIETFVMIPILKEG